MDGLEKKLDEVFVKNAPVQLPENAKKWIVDYGPYIDLVLGILVLLGAWSLWQAGHYVNELVNYTDSVYRAKGLASSSLDTAELGASFWIAWVALLAQAIVMIAAFSGLKARKKQGWNLLFYGSLLSLISGLFYGLYDNSVFSIFARLVGSAIGLYFLFQIRSYYLDKKPGNKVHKNTAAK